jgi:hypothetical protein
MKTKAAYIYIIADLILILFSIIMGGLWLINTQVAFISSMLVIFASFFSYKGMVEKRLEEGDIPKERELLDKIDDKYELFEDEEELQKQELSQKEFVKLYKEERKKSGGMKLTLNNLFKSKRGLFNPIRLLAYAFLVVAMFVLIRNEAFDAIAFLVGISAIPISSLALGYILKNY